MNYKPLIGLVFLFLLFPLVQAVTLTDTQLNASGSKLLINITPATTIYLDQVIVNNDSIYFEKVKPITTWPSLTFNITNQSRNITVLSSATQLFFKQNDSKGGYIQADYDAGADNLTIICNGTSSIVVAGLSSFVAGYTTEYNIFHDHILLGKSTSDTYTISSCSEWEFSAMPANANVPTFNQMIVVFGIVSGLLGLIILIIFASQMIPFLKSGGRDEIDWDYLRNATITIILVAVLLAIAMIVFSNFSYI